MDKLFGYAWEDIQRAQQGGELGRKVDTSKPAIAQPDAKDLALLAEHGSVAALESAGFYGTAERIRQAQG